MAHVTFRIAALCFLGALCALHTVHALSCEGGTGRAECGVEWDAPNYFAHSGRCVPDCETCACPEAACIQIVSACLTAPGLVSYEVSLAGCKGSGSSPNTPSAIDW
jgi:hypothetical protein